MVIPSILMTQSDQLRISPTPEGRLTWEQSSRFVELA